jgi:two-component system response regulator YesN
MYRVVIIEDEEIIRKGLVYSANWAELNCSVVAEGRNGIEGIEAIKENTPDIVIVDINMPVMDGLEMIRQTYEQYDYSAIILSGYSNFEYAQRAIQYGVLGYLLKPLNTLELKEVILRAQKECEIRHVFEDNRRSKQEWKQVNLLTDNNVKPIDDIIVSQMLDYIYINYQNRIVIQDVVNELNYSETFLNNRFKEAVGTTYIEYLNRFRIQKALELLREGKSTIQDIAWKCGIGEYKYFGTVFKKYIGCSPKEYLKEISE